MNVLFYNDLDYKSVKKQFDKTIGFLKKGDFKSADVKKMPQTGYYRAKLDRENRLLFKIGEYAGKPFIFVLEVILNHEYDKSRFLNGAKIDDNKLQAIDSPQKIQQKDKSAVAFVNQEVRHFHILDKILSFDSTQEEIFQAPVPVIIIGSAGSGKTALTLEKIKQLRGTVLYITLSPYLVENSRNIYYSHGYDNEKQEIDFLSFQEYLGTIDLPQGREVTYRDFEGWIWRYKQAYKIKDAYKIFEEFKGVMTGSIIDKPYLSKEEYLGLGVRQSVYSQAERTQLYELFLKYLDWLNEGAFFDSNISSYERLEKVKPIYDFIVVDEVQDITNVQLFLILKSLTTPTNFILCGDSNQIVHPNFFSWSNVKTMFYQQDLKGKLTRILHTNYRNTPEVTEIANQLLLVKNARFGSIDRESTYLVKSNSASVGVSEFYEDKPKVKQDFNRRTGKSAKFAVLVMRNEDKAEARKFFNTPLLFSVQEAKGLEYENIILYNFISNNQAEFRELCNGVTPADLKSDLKYSRAKDKSDKSLEVYKFYVNSLYVAITRAVKNLYVIESARKHELLQLLGLVDFKQNVGLKDQTSSMEEWQKEARKLELQGKKEQADDIRKNILHVETVPWEVVTPSKFTELKKQALDPDNYNKKAKDLLYEYALMYYEVNVFPKLIELKYRKAESWERDGISRIERKYNEYFQDKLVSIQSKLRKYGPDFRTEFNLTPLMMSTLGGSLNTINFLLEVSANTKLRDNLGRQAFQIALLKSYQDKKYATNILGKVYTKLQPDSLRVKIHRKLIKIHPKQMEFFMLNYMIALLGEITTHKIQHDVPGFEATDFVNSVEHYSSQVMADYRKKRTYLSSFLSKNEINRNDKYNKQIFTRIRRGYYLINPILEVENDEGEWQNIYEVTGVADLKNSKNPTFKHLGEYIEQIRKTIQKQFETTESGLLEGN
jgi:hypothetical protein